MLTAKEMRTWARPTPTGPVKQALQKIEDLMSVLRKGNTRVSIGLGREVDASQIVEDLQDRGFYARVDRSFGGYGVVIWW